MSHHLIRHSVLTNIPIRIRLLLPHPSPHYKFSKLLPSK
ncbi:hypothetical protein SS1G_08994 [Sclerotinia sclerotiorum 1980 UF-70]|uniref:Uncharacterized protein n=1 Tax=Sclerotinia sclerotiorum (strain ATCC 18683 / 1980 / Ss-1) TaxID=665079 RepID=A7EUI7_SCLS1|nr:hypothetical protein SS1G_08994 [Sclerotinia sclerotiorum 1980 UF-70]EDN93129.1 hypothetical protein SS1G_08994 [Sclerotinia sclerotiorum 1980 UF-70]